MAQRPQNQRPKAPSADYDYSEYVAPATSNALAVLYALAEEQLDAEAAVAEAQAALAKAQAKLRDVAERRLPEAMEEIGQTSFTTRTGLKVDLDETIRSSVSKDNRERAWAWLRARGDDAIIKRKIFVEFGKGEDEKAEKLRKTLSAQYEAVSDDATVHPQTLSAYVRRTMEKGVDIPLDVFGVHRQRCAKIQKPSS